MWRLVCFFLLVCGTLHAQLKEFMVSEMPRPEVAVVQANAQYPDDALVLIYSDIDGLEFRSSLNKLDKQSYNAASGRYELLLAPLKQIIFVAKSGFIEHKVTTLNPKPKDVYYFKVENAPQNYTGKKGSLSIITQPSGADIYIMGIKAASKTPFITDQLNIGKIEVSLKKHKYDEIDTSVIINSNEATVLKIDLTPATLYVNVNSTPEGAKVFLSDTLLGVTPLSKEIILSDKQKRGYRKLSVQKNGYYTYKEEIRLLPSLKPLEVNCYLEKIKGKIFINSQPDGASVFLNNIYKGVTPLTDSVAIGQYAVSVSLDKHSKPPVQTLFVAQNTPTDAYFYLKAFDVNQNIDEASEISYVKIGSQIWMNANLEVDRFRNGAVIPHISSAREWESAGNSKQPAWCYNDNDSLNGAIYGKLYNWYAVNSAQGLCPAGWRVANETDWQNLKNYLGHSSVIGEKLKSTAQWKNEGNGSNESKFNATPAGYRTSKGEFKDNGNIAAFWSASWTLSKLGFMHVLSKTDTQFSKISKSKNYAVSVRCIKN